MLNRKYSYVVVGISVVYGANGSIMGERVWLNEKYNLQWQKITNDDQHLVKDTKQITIYFIQINYILRSSNGTIFEAYVF